MISVFIYFVLRVVLPCLCMCVFAENRRTSDTVLRQISMILISGLLKLPLYVSVSGGESPIGTPIIPGRGCPELNPAYHCDTSVFPHSTPPPPLPGTGSGIVG